MKTVDELLELIENSKFVLDKRQPEIFHSEGRLLERGFGDWVIIGDLHGDKRILDIILNETNFVQKVRDSDATSLLCLGDYIDRGPKQVEVLETLLELLCAYPKNVVLLRGNHEGPKDLPVDPHDFPQILRKRYPEHWVELYEAFMNLFKSLWTACLFPREMFLVHGGIPSGIGSMDDIAYAHQRHPEKRTLEELLWSDPCKLKGFTYNYRGFGRCFGVDVLDDFLELAGVPLVVRGHEYMPSMYNWDMETRLLTLFSCMLPVYGNDSCHYLVHRYRSGFGKPFRVLEGVKTVHRAVYLGRDYGVYEKK